MKIINQYFSPGNISAAVAGEANRALVAPCCHILYTEGSRDGTLSRFSGDQFTEANISFSSRFKIFPEGFFGRLSARMILLGHLNPARLFLQ